MYLKQMRQSSASTMRLHLIIMILMMIVNTMQGSTGGSINQSYADDPDSDWPMATTY